MPRVSATTVVPGRVSEAEGLWYDSHRWAAWIDGFGHIATLDDEWPHPGARLVWDSRPKGRGRVLERAVAYEPRDGQTVEVEDEKLTGRQSVAFAPEGDEVRVNLTLEYSLKDGNPVLDVLFIRRALRDSLRRTLTRFAHERRAEVTRS
jgi:polyketide cyclase/dehydrase/lipid transport protein